MPSRKCHHYWYYDHTVYSDNRRSVIHRQCSICGKRQIAYATEWRAPRGNWSLPDLRDNDGSEPNAQA